MVEASEESATKQHVCMIITYYYSRVKISRVRLPILLVVS